MSLDSHEYNCPYCGGSGTCPRCADLQDMNAESGCPSCNGSGFKFKPFQMIDLADYQPLNRQDGGEL